MANADYEPLRRTSSRPKFWYDLHEDEHGHPVSKSLFVGDIPPGIREDKVRSIFEEYGEIQYTRHLLSRQADRGYAFVNYKDFESAQRALFACHMRDLFNQGVGCTVRFTTSQDQAKPLAPRPQSSRISEARSEWFQRPKAATFINTTIKNDGNAMRASEPSATKLPPSAPQKMLKSGWKTDTCSPRTTRFDVSPPPLRRSDVYKPVPRSPRDEYRRLSDSDHRPQHHDLNKPKNLREDSHFTPSHNTEARVRGSVEHTERDSEVARRARNPPQSPTSRKEHLSKKWSASRTARHEFFRWQSDKSESTGKVVESQARQTMLNDASAEIAPAGEDQRIASQDQMEATPTTIPHLANAFRLPQTSLQTTLVEASSDNLVAAPSALAQTSPAVSRPSATNLQDNPTAQEALTSTPLSRLRVPTDDTSSITSSSTKSSQRKTLCAHCKSADGVLLGALIKCSTCTRRFHSSCGYPSPDSARDNHISSFVSCGRCLRKSRSSNMTELRRQVSPELGALDEHDLSLPQATRDDTTANVDRPCLAPQPSPTEISVSGAEHIDLSLVQPDIERLSATTTLPKPPSNVLIDPPSHHARTASPVPSPVESIETFRKEVAELISRACDTQDPMDEAAAWESLSDRTMQSLPFPSNLSTTHDVTEGRQKVNGSRTDGVDPESLVRSPSISRPAAVMARPFGQPIARATFPSISTGLNTDVSPSEEAPLKKNGLMGNGTPSGKKSRSKACEECQRSKRRCVHDQNGRDDPAKAAEPSKARGSNSVASVTIFQEASAIALCYKTVTCPEWRSRRCKYREEDCLLAHRDTGIDPPTNRYSPMWTCYDWLHRRSCSQGLNCNLAHHDTGLHAGPDRRFSKKHITCGFWQKGSCKFAEHDCLYGHCNTGIVANTRKGRNTGSPNLFRYDSASQGTGPSTDISDRVSAGSPTASILHQRQSSSVGISASILQEHPQHDYLGDSWDATDALPTAESQARKRPQSLEIDTHVPASDTADSSPYSPKSTIETAHKPVHGLDTPFSPTSHYSNENGEIEHGVDTPYSATSATSATELIDVGKDTEMSNRDHTVRTPVQEVNAEPTIDTSPSSAPMSIESRTSVPDILGALPQAQAGTDTQEEDTGPLFKRPSKINDPAAIAATGLLTPAVSKENSVTTDKTLPTPKKHLARRSTIDPRLLSLSRMASAVAKNVLPIETNSVLDVPKIKKMNKKCERCDKQIFSSATLCNTCSGSSISAKTSPDRDTSTTNAFRERSSSVEVLKETQKSKLVPVTPVAGRNSSTELENRTSNVERVKSLKRPHEEILFIKQKKLRVIIPAKKTSNPTGIKSSSEMSSVDREAAYFMEMNKPKARPVEESVSTEGTESIPTRSEVLPSEPKSGKPHKQAEGTRENQPPNVESVPKATDRRQNPHSERGSNGKYIPKHSLPQRQSRSQSPSPATMPRSRRYEKSINEKAHSVLKPGSGDTRIPEEPVVSQLTSARCSQCAVWHKKCLHDSSGQLDPARCAQYLEECRQFRKGRIGFDGTYVDRIKAAARLHTGTNPDSDSDGEYDDDSDVDSHDADEESGPNSAISSQDLLGGPQLESQQPRVTRTDEASGNKRSFSQTGMNQESRVLMPTLAPSSLQNFWQPDAHCGLPVRLREAAFKNRELLRSYQTFCNLIGKTVGVSKADIWNADETGILDRACQKHGLFARTAIILATAEVEEIRLRYDPVEQTRVLLRERGVRFDSDSGDEPDEAMVVTRALETLPSCWPPKESSRHLFEVGPALRPRQIPTAAVQQHPSTIADLRASMSKKQVWKHLLGIQCRERRAKFGNPHQTKERDLSSSTMVKTTVQVELPLTESQRLKFHVPSLETREVEIPFERFLGMPEEPIVTRERQSLNKGELEFDLAYRDGKKDRDRAVTLTGRRVRENGERWPFTKG